LGVPGAEVEEDLFFFLRTQTTMTTRRRKTETARQMTRIKTGSGSSTELFPPVGGTFLFGKMPVSEKNKLE
jgi:hypothetical protein